MVLLISWLLNILFQYLILVVKFAFWISQLIIWHWRPVFINSVRNLTKILIKFRNFPINKLCSDKVRKFFFMIWFCRWRLNLIKIIFVDQFFVHLSRNISQWHGASSFSSYFGIRAIRTKIIAIFWNSNFAVFSQTDLCWFSRKFRSIFVFVRSSIRVRIIRSIIPPDIDIIRVLNSSFNKFSKFAPIINADVFFMRLHTDIAEPQSMLLSQLVVDQFSIRFCGLGIICIVLWVVIGTASHLPDALGFQSSFNSYRSPVVFVSVHLILQE